MVSGVRAYFYMCTEDDIFPSPGMTPEYVILLSHLINVKTEVLKDQNSRLQGTKIIGEQTRIRPRGSNSSQAPVKCCIASLPCELCNLK